MASNENGRSVSGQKASEEAYRNSDKANPIAVERYLKGVDYLASKHDLTQCAEQNNAPEDIMDIINQLPEQQYQSPVDISKAVGRMN